MDKGSCLTLATRFTIYDFGYEVDAGGSITHAEQVVWFCCFYRKRKNCSG